jgi:hypothetical protein
MWDMVEHLCGRKLPAAARIIDPACGEGVFLQGALGRGSNWQLYGVDIDASLGAAWRRDANLTAAHLNVANGLVDDPATGLEPGAFDVAIGNPPFAGVGLKDVLGLLDSPQAHGGQPDLFGNGASQPVSANGQAQAQRRSRDHLVRQLARYNCWRLRGRPNDRTDDPDLPGLFAESPAEAKRAARGRVDEDLARPILEWPSDRPLDIRSPAIRAAVQRMAATAIEVYFVERFLRLARPGGMIAMILPDSILSSDQLGSLRSWFMDNARLLAVVALPRHVFTGVGAKAVTGIVFAQRYTAAEQKKSSGCRRRAAVRGCRPSGETRGCS